MTIATGMLTRRGCCAQLSQKLQPVGDRHPHVEDDRVGRRRLGHRQPSLGGECGHDPETLQLEHPRERVRDRPVVVHDQDRARGGFGKSRLRWGDHRIILSLCGLYVKRGTFRAGARVYTVWQRCEQIPRFHEALIQGTVWRGGEVSPILVRPVREQLEHDRVIRLLQVKLKRKHDVVTNIGEDQTVPVRIGQVQIFPDLVLTSVDRGKKLMGTVEVETAESVNHLEAMAQWAHLGRARAPFHLYVPAGCVDIARRLASENGVNVAEIWSYHTIGDQTRFTLVHRAPASEPRRAVGDPRARRTQPAVEPAGRCQVARRGCARAEGAGQGHRESRPDQARHGREAGDPLAKKEVSPAHASVHPRQARLREHLRRPHAAPPEQGSVADPLLVPDAARRPRRPRGASTKTRSA